MCYGAEKAYVSALIDNLHRLYGPVYPNRKVQEHILAIATNFWQHVENNTEPMPETWDDVKLLNPNIEADKKIMVGGEKLETVFQLTNRGKEIKEKIKKLKEEEDDIKKALGLIISDNKLIEDPEGNKLVSQHEITRETVSLSAIKKENENLYNQLNDYIKVSTSRVLKY
jgi:hypothetical protein